MAILNYEVHDNIARITLNRPQRRNAMNPEMCVLLDEAWRKVQEDDGVRVAIISAVGSTFCAGADLAALMPVLSGAKQPQDQWDQKVADDKGVVFRALLRNFDPGKPIIAAIGGHAIAGGMEILQAIDIRVAVENIKLGVQEVKWALVPGGGSTVRLPRQIPYAKAMELLLTGDTISSQEALELGFLNYVVPAGEEVDKALEIANKIVANGPLAVQATRASVRACSGMEEVTALKIENRYAGKVLKSEDAREGPRAFKEKRKPVFKGC